MAARSILFVNRVYPPDAGATGRLLADVACHMAAQGWQVTVVAEGEGDATPMPGLAVRRTGDRVSGASARAYLGSLGRLARPALAQQRHDLVVTMTDPPVLHLAGPALRARHRAASGAGRVVPPNGEALAAAVQACLEHPGMLEAWTGAAARERAAFRDRPGPAAFAGLTAELLEGRETRPRLIRRLSLPVTTPLGPGHVG